jgi:hypothetical protein
MMVDNIPISEAPGMAPVQAGAESIYNEGVMRTSVLGALYILDRDDTAPPGSPSNGDVYIPKATATGAWATHEGDLAVYFDGWIFISPAAGMFGYIDDEAIWIGYDGTEWLQMDFLSRYFDNPKILDRDLTAPPGGESNGDTYIPATTATGAWAGKEDDLAVYWDGTWYFRTPRGGEVAFVHDEKIWMGYSSQESEWHPLQDIWSTTEHWTGKYSGSDKVYSKVIDTGAGPVATNKNTAHSITSIDLTSRILVQVWIEDSGAYSEWGWRSTVNELYFIKIDATNVVTKSGVDMSSYNIVVRLEYCKT